jgi:formate-dependent nitrite reductase membrane component NrfD
VYYAHAIAAWNVPIIPLAFLSSGLVAGYGFFLILIASKALDSKQTIFVLGFIFLMFNLIIWLTYLWKSPTADFSTATKALRRVFFLTLMIGVSHIIPLLLLLFLLMQNQKMGAQPVYESLIMALSGVLLLIGNIGQKAGIIVAAGYFRGIELRG